MSESKQSVANNSVAVKLIVIVIAGLAFGFAIAPLYDVVCKAIGLNGRGATTATEMTKNVTVDSSREITVLFTGTTMPGLDWSFVANESSVTVHPGEIKLTSYKAINHSSDVVVGSAVPSVTPEVAALYFKKIACFCFTQQALQPGEEKDMPIRFFVSPDLPKDIKTVSLSYAFYKATEKDN